jgi:dihydrofolate reductase
MRASLIAAVAANGVIGRGGGLPWRLPADLQRFKRLTTGHHLVVGRATWESVGRPLPDRIFVVVTRKRELEGTGVRVVGSVREGIRLALAAGDEEPFVAGGKEVYREALENDLVDRVHLTRIHRDYDGDAHFPEFDESRWRLVERDARAADPANDRPAFEFLVYDRDRDA